MSWKTLRVVRELEHVPCEHRQREWGMFSQKRDQISSCSASTYRKVMNKELRSAQFVCGMRTRAQK